MSYNYEEKRKLYIWNKEKKIAIEFKNNWKSANFNSKQSMFKTLNEFTINHADWEVVYGRFDDFKDADYYYKDNIRILIRIDLDFIFGEDTELIK